MTTNHRNDEVTPEDRRQIDRVCDEFEHRLLRGESVRPEDLLDSWDGPLRKVLLDKLLALEAEHGKGLLETEQLDDVTGTNGGKSEDLGSLSFSTHIVDSTDADTTSFSSKLSGEADSHRGLGPTDETMPAQIRHFRVEERIGRGGFGQVYRAFDTQLGRHVAIKGPSLARWERHKHHLRKQLNEESETRIVQEFLDEARKSAGLRHPGIVLVYEFCIETDRPYIVQELINGIELGRWARERKPNYETIASVIMQVAEALAHAHQQGFVHRDLKPANILVDDNDRTHVTDFGMAMHESMQMEHEGEFAGTLPYMSPEQVVGDAHRLDGRTDLWSLGVILYELLAGRRPFDGEPKELIKRIRFGEPRPLRQREPETPEELDRICRRLLQKLPRDRYSSASTLIDDLKNWLDGSETKHSEMEPASESDSTLRRDQESRIIPKGLRSFDQHDAHFFSRLLPGPHDEQGFPERVRFWKHQIEERDATRTFSVGLICGPSGCGKSSLVKAGLFPILDPNISTLYIECSSEGTPRRLSASIRALLPGIPEDLSLVEITKGLREGQWLGKSGKLLICLDQFEQWVHGRDRNESSELLEAIQHCNGSSLQCLLLARDDFWIAVNRIMEVIGVVFVLGKNLTYVDLFDEAHARKVLHEFGRAYRCLPDNRTTLSRDQERFLDKAIAGLTRDGHVICVRISLFADMIKGMPWNSSTLRKVGGTEGVGVAFLESTFSDSSAPASHRYHQKAASAVLGSLLPEEDVDIRGRMQSRESLLERSGYARHPERFNELMRILEGEVRLVTAADPETLDMANEDRDDASESAKYYQLTHDYLVPTLRKWLDLKQSVFTRFRRWAEGANRVHEIGALTLFLAALFTFVHLAVLLMNTLPLQFTDQARSEGVARAMLVWLVFFDPPFLWLGYALARNRRGAGLQIVVYDLIAWTLSLVFFLTPSTYLDLFGIVNIESPATVRGRYGAILFIVTGLLLLHFIAIYSIRVNSARRVQYSKSAY